MKRYNRFGLSMIIVCLMLIFIITSVSAFNGTVNHDVSLSGTQAENTYRGFCITSKYNYKVINITVTSNTVCTHGTCICAVWNTTGCTTSVSSYFTPNEGQGTLNTGVSDIVDLNNQNIYLEAGNSYFIGCGTESDSYIASTSASAGLPDYRTQLNWNNSGYLHGDGKIRVYTSNAYVIQNISLDNTTVVTGGGTIHPTIAYPSSQIYGLDLFNWDNKIYINGTTLESDVNCSLNTTDFNIIDNSSKFNFLNNTPINRTNNWYEVLCFNNSDRTINGTDTVNVLVNTTYALDNCTIFSDLIMNWSYHRSPYVGTTGDSLINVTCQPFYDLNYDISYTAYSYDTHSSTLCSNHGLTNMICDGKIDYTGYWTHGWVYDRNFYDYNLNSTVPTYLNLTIPKLFLNFSEVTDVKLITLDEVRYFNDINLLIAQTNLTIGKVSVVFNNGTQFYEYYNDLNTYISEDLTVIDNQDDYVNVIAQDSTFGGLPEATIKIYELDSINNRTLLINSLYGNIEKEVKLNGNVNYLAKVSYSGYEQTTGPYPFTPDSLEGDDLIMDMRESLNASYLYIDMNVGNILYFEGRTESYYDLNVLVESAVDVFVDIYWYINGSQIEIGSSNGQVGRYTMQRKFNQGDDQHEVYVRINGNLAKTFIISEEEKNLQYDENYFTSLRTSKLGFVFFFIFSIIISLGIHTKHRNYGIQTMTVISVILSFLNLYMIIIALPLVFGLIAKKVNGDDL